MSEDNTTAETQADIMAALNHLGWESVEDLHYWAKGNDLDRFDQLVQAFARHRHQSETGAALPSDGREALVVAALSKIMPITFDNGPDYMSLYFGDGSGAHSTQAMTMHPQDWYDLQTAYEAALSQSTAGEDGA